MFNFRILAFDKVTALAVCMMVSRLAMNDSKSPRRFHRLWRSDSGALKTHASFILPNSNPGFCRATTLAMSAQVCESGKPLP